MKRIIIFICLIFPATVWSQIVVKGGLSLANRWDEKLNAQTLGIGFRISGEKFILPNLSIGTELSYHNFKPNNLLNVAYKSFDLLATYYVTTKIFQPYIGIGLGYTKYTDKTTLDLGGGQIAQQTRDKNYGNISPHVGMKYNLRKDKKIALFIQSNAELIPVVNIIPIGFLSITTGLSVRI